MANRTYLLRADEHVRYKDIRAETIVCAASYMIPVFWYMLYDITDQVDWVTPCDDGSDYHYPGFVKDANDSLQLARSRLPNLTTHFPRAISTWFDQWISFLAEQPGKLFIMETCELTWMDPSPAEYRRESIQCIQAFSSPFTAKNGIFRKKTVLGANWRTLLNQADMETPDSATDVYKFCGYSWEKPVPWESSKGTTP